MTAFHKDFCLVSMETSFSQQLCWLPNTLFYFYFLFILTFSFVVDMLICKWLQFLFVCGKKSDAFQMYFVTCTVFSALMNLVTFFLFELFLLHKNQFFVFFCFFLKLWLIFNSSLTKGKFVSLLPPPPPPRSPFQKLSFTKRKGAAA